MMNIFPPALVNGRLALGVAVAWIGSGLFGNGSAAAPSISFQNDTDTGFYLYSAGQVGLSVGGVASFVFTRDGTSPYIQGLGANSPYVRYYDTGAFSIFAAGTNQNITLTPSGTGYVRASGTFDAYNGNITCTTGGLTIAAIGGRLTLAPSAGIAVMPSIILVATSTNSSNGAVQLATHTTSAGGIGFGTDGSLFTSGATVLVWNASSADTQFQISKSGTVNLSFLVDGANAYMSAKASSGLVFRTNGSTTAMTLDSSQNTIAAGSLKTNKATGGIGYATGAGGTVAQATSKATGVTLNKVCGQITMNAANVAAGTAVGFTLTNSNIAIGDLVLVSIGGGATADSYTVGVDQIGAGSCRIQLRNFTAGALAEAVVLFFAVIKGVTA